MEDSPFGLPSELYNLDEYVPDRVEYALNLWFVFSILYSLFHSCLMNSSQAMFGLVTMLLSMCCIFRYRQYQDLNKVIIIDRSKFP